MTTIITRSGKGSALTHAEMDGNLTALRDTADAAATGGALSAHTASTSNPHSVTKAQIGLGSVDNTADTAKPVSTAQAAAIESAVSAHAAAADPHPGYLTQAEASATYAPISVTGVTNLSATASPTGVTITSDTGTDATIAGADATNAGAMLPAQVAKLAGIATGATANSSDATLLNRANHTGSQAISTVAGLQSELDGKATAAQGALAETAVQPAALTGKADLVGGKLVASQLPDIALVQYLGAVASQAEMLALSGQAGDWCTRTDTGATYIITGASPGVIGGWTQLSYPAAPVTSVAGRTGVVTLAAADVTDSTVSGRAVMTGTPSAGLAALGGLGANADAIADVLEASATGAPADLSRVQASVSSGAVQGSAGAAHIIGTIARASATAGVPVRVWAHGDSVSYYISDLLVARIDAATSKIGAGGFGPGCLASNPQGGAAIVSGTRYDVSPTSDAYTIPAGGYVQMSIGGGQQYMTRAAVWMAREPGGGSCKIEIIANDQSTVLQTIAESVDCSGALGVIRRAWAGSAKLGFLRVTGVTGACTLITGAYSNGNISGSEYFNHSKVGTTPELYGAAAWEFLHDALAWFAPDVCVYTQRNSAATVQAYCGPMLLDKYREIAPKSSIIVCGAWARSGEESGGPGTLSHAENEALRAASANVDGVFIDAYKLLPTYSSIVAIDPTYDGVHIGVTARAVLYAALVSATGLGGISGVFSTEPVQNSMTRTTKLAVTIQPGVQDAETVQAISNGNDVDHRLRRLALWTDANGNFRAQVVYPGTGANGGVAWNTQIGFSVNPGNYVRDGDYSITVDPATGVAKLYGRVAGVLKSMTLGTLS